MERVKLYSQQFSLSLSLRLVERDQESDVVFTYSACTGMNAYSPAKATSLSLWLSLGVNRPYVDDVAAMFLPLIL